MVRSRMSRSTTVDVPGAAADLEGVDAVLGEVAEQFSPGRLLLVRRVPDAGAADPVVAAGGDGRVSEREKTVSGRALVPEHAVDLSAADSG